MICLSQGWLHSLSALFSYLLGKRGYVLGSVVVPVCLFVSNIIQKVMNELQ